MTSLSTMSSTIGLLKNSVKSKLSKKDSSYVSVTEKERNPKQKKKYVDPDNGKTREYLPFLAGLSGWRADFSLGKNLSWWVRFIAMQMTSEAYMLWAVHR